MKDALCWARSAAATAARTSAAPRFVAARIDNLFVKLRAGPLAGDEQSFAIEIVRKGFLDVVTDLFFSKPEKAEYMISRDLFERRERLGSHR
jgi:hypothetical protein